MNGLPEDVRRFLLDHVDSIEQLEILLLLHRQRRGWTADEVCRELRGALDSCTARLHGLARHGLVVETAEPGRFELSRDAAVTRAVSSVEREYRERRFTVINFIASKHLDRIRSFADAFRLGKGK